MSGAENGTKEITQQDTEWRVEEPDEAKYNFSDEKGVWQPKPEDILLLFEKLAEGGPLPLKWTCPGRRPPVKDVKQEENKEERMDVDEEDSKGEESKIPETSAFDFDEPHVDVNAKLTPRRAPGGLGRTPRPEKKVARMDNIMKSLQKQQLERAAEREARRAKGSPSSGTSGGRARLLNFGSPGSTSAASSSSLTPGSPGSAAATSKTTTNGLTITGTTSNKSLPVTATTSSGNNAPKTSADVSVNSSSPHSKAPNNSVFQYSSNVGTAAKTGSFAFSDTDKTTVSLSDEQKVSGSPHERSSPVASLAPTPAQSGEMAVSTLSTSLQRSTPNTTSSNETLSSVTSSATNNLITTQTIPNPIPATENISLDKEFAPERSSGVMVRENDQSASSKPPTATEVSHVPAASNQPTSQTSISSVPQPMEVTAPSTEGSAADAAVNPTPAASDTVHQGQPPIDNETALSTNVTTSTASDNMDMQDSAKDSVSENSSARTNAQVN